MDNNVVTRFPPSPTGFFHVGGVRTALFNYLFARKHAGKFILRIEDTDKERSKKEFEDDIVSGLAWLGLTYDEGPIRQSGRTEIYRAQLEKLIHSGNAYVSKEKDVKEGGRQEVIRFKNPDRRIFFDDLIRGRIEFDTTELADFIIAKSIDEPLYHFAVVVDDVDMGITHVIRGEEHISNTPRQILMIEALGGKRPEYAHLPLILDKDRSKLSKRKHGECVSLRYYIEKGYLREAVINYMALLGWNSGTNKELFSIDELIQNFDFGKVQKSGAIFDETKLAWFNKQYMLKLGEDGLAKKLEDYIPLGTLEETMRQKLIPIIIERVSTFGEAKILWEQGEFSYVKGVDGITRENLVWKDSTEEATKKHLHALQSLLLTIPDEAFTKDTVKSAVWEYASKEGRGAVLWPLRMSLSGKEKSPDPFVLADLLGKAETLRRLQAAQNIFT